MSAYQVEFAAVWPGPDQAYAIEPTQDRAAFFIRFDEMINHLMDIKCPKNLRPTVEVRALMWSEWMSYGTAQNRKLFT